MKTRENNLLNETVQNKVSLCERRKRRIEKRHGRFKKQTIGKTKKIDVEEIGGKITAACTKPIIHQINKAKQMTHTHVSISRQIDEQAKSSGSIFAEDHKVRTHLGYVCLAREIPPRL